MSNSSKSVSGTKGTHAASPINLGSVNPESVNLQSVNLQSAKPSAGKPSAGKPSAGDKLSSKGKTSNLNAVNLLDNDSFEDRAGHRSHALAPVQRETLEYLRRFISENGYAPTLKDISTYIGVRSPSTAHFHLSRLEDKGFIKRGDDGSFELIDREELRVVAGPCAVPLLGLIAAGSPIEAIEDTSVMVDIPPQFLDSRSEIYCLQVTGDSMIDAHIMDGDVIIVRRQETADNGEIVVAVLDDGQGGGNATVKTFRRLKGGKVMLVPHNPNHQPIPAETAKIRGRVIGLLREL